MFENYRASLPERPSLLRTWLSPLLRNTAPTLSRTICATGQVPEPERNRRSEQIGDQIPEVVHRPTSPSDQESATDRGQGRASRLVALVARSRQIRSGSSARSQSGESKCRLARTRVVPVPVALMPAARRCVRHSARRDHWPSRWRFRHPGDVPRGHLGHAKPWPMVVYSPRSRSRSRRHGPKIPHLRRSQRQADVLTHLECRSATARVTTASTTMESGARP